MSAASWFDSVSTVPVFCAFLATLWYRYRAHANSGMRDRERRASRAGDPFEQMISGTEVSVAYLERENMLRSAGTARHGFHTYTLVSDKDFEPGGLLDAESTVSGSASLNAYTVMR